MLTSNFDFHLTGSRYFGTERPHSDIDFFAVYSVEAEAFLFQLGFYKQSHMCSGYTDTNTVAVYKYVGTLIPEIHVQLVEDANLKAKAQVLLKTMYPGMGDFSSITWDGAFRYLTMVAEEAKKEKANG